MRQAWISRAALAIAVLAMTGAIAACGAGDNDAAEPRVEEGVTSVVDLETAGPKVGDLVPVKIELVDAEGEVTTLADIVGTKGSVLVFARSVEWCPFCQAQLKEIDEIAGDVRDSGYTLAAITYDSVGQLQQFRTDQDIGYLLLSDRDSEQIDALGLRDPQYTQGPAQGVPYASILILDTEGRVVGRSVSEDYKLRPGNREILSLIRKIG